MGIPVRNGTLVAQPWELGVRPARKKSEKKEKKGKERHKYREGVRIGRRLHAVPKFVLAFSHFIKKKPLE